MCQAWNDILESFNLLHSYYPYFNRGTALKELDRLNVVSQDLMRSLISRASSYEELEKELENVRTKRDELIANEASKGKTIPVDNIIKSLDKLLDENPGNEEIAAEVKARKKELLAKYKEGVPVEVAYQWQKDGEEQFGWDAIHKD